MELFLEKNFSVNEARNNFSSFYVFHSLILCINYYVNIHFKVINMIRFGAYLGNT